MDDTQPTSDDTKPTTDGAMADGYYAEDDMNTEELDLSFLDDDKDKK